MAQRRKSYCKKPGCPGRRACRECRNISSRAVRPKHRDLSFEEKVKANARSYANVYLKRGLLIKQPCNLCGSPDSQMHHEDYTKPLKVDWLCRPCHLKLHGVHGVPPSEIWEITSVAQFARECNDALGALLETLKGG